VVLTLLLWWILLACTIFVIVCAARAIKYARAPIHLRWDLYPVAHEPASVREHGGSYLEEKDWWTKPRHKSHLGEIITMGEEILLLKGVWENNRPVWWGSLPFHWGLYTLIVVTVGLVVAGLGFAPGWFIGLLSALGVIGGVLTGAGALILLVLRSTDRKLRPYTTPLDKLNLLLLTVIGALSTAVVLIPPGMAGVASALGQIVRLQVPQVSTLLALQMALAALFVLYMPFTRMVHFFSKYFTYHHVRWDDKPVEPGSALDRRLDAARHFGIAWSADHVRTGKTWVEVVTTMPQKQKDGD
jgi:nitrate reductase gamma subunit